MHSTEHMIQHSISPPTACLSFINPPLASSDAKVVLGNYQWTFHSVGYPLGSAIAL